MGKKDRPAWITDGKRFVASLQKVDDLACYKDFFDSDKLHEAQMMANNSAQREQCKAIVFDRHQQEVAFRCDFTASAPKELPETRGGKRK